MFVGLLVWCGSIASLSAAGRQDPAAFRAFVEGLRPDAESRGVSRAVFDSAFAGVTPDPAVVALTVRQPEFAKPIGVYLASQVTAARIAAGQAMLAKWRPELDAIERTSGVPAPVVVALWGLETNYGASLGGKDVIRSMATLASIGFRPELYRAELLAALTMLQHGEVTREGLRGSWAGAMGQPQFMPSSFETYAVDFDHDGRRDIWGDIPDALASMANFIRQHGWQTDRPWGFEVRLPTGFDYRRSRASDADWAALGVTRADGAALPAEGDGIMFFPSGATGPAFLVTGNFEVIKTYNFSDAYVLSVAQLADRMGGGPPIRASWPTATPISRQDRIDLQTRMVALGLPVDNREGRISLALRDAIRSAQEKVGLVPDGEPTTALLKALERRSGQP